MCIRDSYYSGVGVLPVVAQAYSGFHLIYVLSAGTTASESVPFDFPFVNFHIKRLGFG